MICDQVMNCDEKPYEGDLSFEHAQADAATKGLVVVLPKADKLFLDIDTEEAITTFTKQTGLVAKYLPVREICTLPSKNGYPRRHITVRVGRDLTPLERIALQAILGSDLKRELLSWARLTAGNNPNPTLFFEKAA